MKFLAILFFRLIIFLFQTEPASSSMKNLNFLFAAYAIVWLLIIGYLFSLSRRQKKLAREMEALKQMQKR
jgi:CcmD family protein